MHKHRTHAHTHAHTHWGDILVQGAAVPVAKCSAGLPCGRYETKDAKKKKQNRIKFLEIIKRKGGRSKVPITKLKIDLI